MEVKLNMKFRGVCPHCSVCNGFVMIDLSGRYMCSEGCPHYSGYQSDIQRRRRLLNEALRRREERRLARMKAAAEAKAKAEEAKVRAEAEELTRLFDSTPWSEPEWMCGEFPRHYAAGWRMEWKDVRFKGKQRILFRYTKGPRVLISKEVALPVNDLERMVQ